MSIAVDLDTYMKRFTPGGTQTRSKSGLFPAPVAIRSARGSRVIDDEGREYVDWISGLCAITLGYRHAEVDEAVTRQIRDHGVTFPLATRAEAVVAERLCEALKWPEQVRWVKTGSEATAAAILVARAATGRRKIVSVGYHGWHPEHLPGPDLIALPFNARSAAEAITGETAAVILELLRDGSAPQEWLGGIVQRARDLGALVIMDEIVTGFRWAIGGATEFLHLDPPDLACFGKGMANGYPLGALVGPTKLMRHAVNVSSTFGGEGIGLAACKATLDIYEREKVIERLWKTGTALSRALGEAGIRHVGYPVHPKLLGPPGEASARAAAQGVLLIASGLNPTAAHTPEDIAETAKALA